MLSSKGGSWFELAFGEHANVVTLCDRHRNRVFFKFSAYGKTLGRSG